MKITLKTVKGQQIPFDVEPDMTVSLSIHCCRTPGCSNAAFQGI
jgi:hypothetical protein